MRWCLGHVYNGKTCRVLLTPEVHPKNTQRNTNTNVTKNTQRNTRKGGRSPLPGGGTPAGVPGEWRAMPKGGAERTRSGRGGARSATVRGRGGPPRPRPPKALPAMGAARGGGARCAHEPRTHEENGGCKEAGRFRAKNNEYYVMPAKENIISHFFRRPYKRLINGALAQCRGGGGARAHRARATAVQRRARRGKRGRMQM